MASSVRLASSQVDLLNLIRGMGAQLVLIGHASHAYWSSVNPRGRLETFGVLIFFLLSGFLIASSVLQKWQRNDYRFEHYLIDRFCRIFVAYVPALVLVAAADAAMRGNAEFPYQDNESLWTWLGNLAMLQEYPVFQILRRLGSLNGSWSIEIFGSGRPFWTVAIEWWIYLFFGYLAFFVLRGRRLTARNLAILGVLGVVPAYNAMGGTGDCLTFVWIIGALFALLQNWLVGRARRERGSNSSLKFPIVCILGIAVSACLLAGRIVKTELAVYDLQFALFAAGILFGLFFLAGSTDLKLPLPLRRAVDFLAAFSYSLYLVHYTVLTMFAIYFPSSSRYDPSKLLMVFVLANVVGIIFWGVFEKHHHAIAELAKSMLGRRRRKSGTQTELVESLPRG